MNNIDNVFMSLTNNNLFILNFLISINNEATFFIIEFQQKMITLFYVYTL